MARVVARPSVVPGGLLRTSPAPPAVIRRTGARLVVVSSVPAAASSSSSNVRAAPEKRLTLVVKFSGEEREERPHLEFLPELQQIAAVAEL